MKKYIWFDMDGTLVDFYGVKDWLPKLRAFDASPFLEAAPMLRMSTFAKKVNALQRRGWKIGIVSWGSKESTPAFDKKIEQAKKQWLREHLPSVVWDEIIIVPYGTNKYTTAGKAGMLFDDNETILGSWKSGHAHKPEEIFSVLSGLLEGY